MWTRKQLKSIRHNLHSCELSAGRQSGLCSLVDRGDWEDPLVVANYKEYHIPTLTSSIERAAPPILMNGTGEYETALDENLQAVLAGTKTAEQAMADAAAEPKKEAKLFLVSNGVVDCCIGLSRGCRVTSKVLLLLLWFKHFCGSLWGSAFER